MTITPREAKRQKMLRMLEESPEDTFLQYSLALHIANDGEHQAAIKMLETLLAREPGYVAAWFQAGQLALQIEDRAASRAFIERGLVAARNAGDDHAFGEMSQFLAQLEE